MNKFNYSDNIKRKNCYNRENKKLLKKSILNNLFLKNSIRMKISYDLFNENKMHSKVILKNRCIITGRKSKIRKNLNFSRLCFRRLARSCSISGIRKSSW
tara:strand:- start:292 stop:591 length:300 start_codon:yes stop_codon:yes gene_type:complete